MAKTATTIERDEKQFTLRQDGHEMGTLDFQRPRAGVLQIDFVSVKPAARGSGLGRQLVVAAVQWARDERLTVVARCSYARAVIDGDPSLRNVLRS